MQEFFKTMVIVNPNSANGNTAKQWPGIRDLIRTVLPEFASEMTSAPGDASEIARRAIKDGYEMVVSLGGDGTNNEVVNGFFEGGEPINSEAVLGVISRGTGSDLIKTLGIPKDPQEAVKRLAGRSSAPCDVGHLTLVDHAGQNVDRYFINIASFGIGGDIDRRVNNTSKALGGFVSFLWGSVVSIFAYSNREVEISIDGKSIGTRKIFSCAVANGQYFGGGMWVAPEAKMDDGLFDIVLMGDLGLMETLTQMSSIYKGKHLEHPKIEAFRGKRVEATSSEEVLLDVDGEQPGGIPSIFEILPGAIRIKR